MKYLLIILLFTACKKQIDTEPRISLMNSGPTNLLTLSSECGCMGETITASPPGTFCIMSAGSGGGLRLTVVAGKATVNRGIYYNLGEETAEECDTSRKFIDTRSHEKVLVEILKANRLPFGRASVPVYSNFKNMPRLDSTTYDN